MHNLPNPPQKRPYPALPSRARFRRRIGCATLLMIPLLCLITFVVTYLLLPPPPIDVLILGVDARTSGQYTTRTDSVMLLNITPRTFNVSLVSIPRDVFITVPGYGEQRINTINVLGEQEQPGSGPALVRRSIQESFGVDVDHVVRLDFEAFVKLVDAVGGIEVDVPKRIVDYAYPAADGGTITVTFEPGRQHLNGEQALQYARTRHQDDDFQRAGRQQQVVDALVSKLMDPRQIVHYPAVVHAVTQNTDTDLSILDMFRYAPGLLLGWPGRETLVLNRDYLVAMKGNDSGYWVPNYAMIQDWFDANFD